MARQHDLNDAFFPAAQRFVDTCLRSEGSLFVPDRSTWSSVPVTDLYRRVVEQPDWSKGVDFSQKLRGQLDGALPDVVLLASEMLYLLLLTQDTSVQSKWDSLNPILELVQPPIVIPDELTRPFGHGIASYGAALAFRYRQYVFLLEFAREWLKLGAADRDDLLSDPDAFNALLFSLPRKGASSQVEALLYVVFPDTFEPIVSVSMQDQIISTFSRYAGNPSLPRYKRLALIREALSQEHGDAFSFWDPDIRNEWEPPVTPPPLPEPAIDLVVKWSTKAGPDDTVDKHRAVADNAGSVWWGLLGPAGKPRLSAKTIDQLKQQLKGASRTSAFLSGPSCWRTTLLELTTSISEVDSALVPDYYSDTKQEHRLWVRLADFEPIDQSWLLEHLELASESGKPLSPGALGNTQNPLIVRVAETREAAKTPRVWWVCQGSTYRSARDQGVMWAPKAGRDGRARQHWRSLQDARLGDRTLHYANGSVRAWSTVAQEAVVARQPTGRSEHWPGDGLLVRADYHELGEPIPLADIPLDWRVDEQLPFTKDGAVQQGYFFPLSDRFVQRLAGRFPQLQLPQQYSVARPPLPTAEFDLPSLEAAASDTGLKLPADLYAQLLAALASDKHVILTGPPGTAKTTLAHVVAGLAQRAGRCNGFMPTTATSDWTTYDTIGGLHPKSDATLEFQPGHFLRAIEDNRWLVIDELNRSNFDRAFGQLFTVLSGQTVVLPYERRAGKGYVTLIPAGTEPPADNADVTEVPATWRIVATMNVFDKTLLFELSYALMRRFAFIEVPSPSTEVFVELIDGWAEGDRLAASVARQLLTVRGVKDIGPAAYRDIARYVRERRGLDEPPHQHLVFDSFYSFLLPQFEGIDEKQGETLLAALAGLLDEAGRTRLRDTLNTVLGLELRAKPATAGSADQAEQTSEPAEDGAGGATVQVEIPQEE